MPLRFDLVEHNPDGSKMPAVPLYVDGGHFDSIKNGVGLLGHMITPALVSKMAVDKDVVLSGKDGRVRYTITLREVKF